MNMKKAMLVFLGIMCFCFSGKAQRVALKTNALGWLTASPNLESEFILSDHFSFNMGVMGNYLHTSKLKTSFIHFQPEVRYWFSRPQVRHFIGASTFITDYNFLINDKYHKGDAFAAGLTYGYSWILNSHWNIEATAGLGFLRYRQFKYGVDEARPTELNDKKSLFAPIKLGVSVVYIIK